MRTMDKRPFWQKKNRKVINIMYKEYQAEEEVLLDAAFLGTWQCGNQ